MGSLESVGQSPLKREGHHFLQQNRSTSFGQHKSTPTIRSRIARLLLFKKIGYLQWLCTVAVFFFFVVVFQMFLPGSVMEKSADFTEPRSGSVVVTDEALALLKEFGGLGFGEDFVEFEAFNVLNKFHNEGVADNGTVGSRTVVRFGFRKPKLALVFGDLLFDPYQIKMYSLAAALREIGYDIEVFSLEDGPLHAVWNDSGFPVNVIQSSEDMTINVDWLNYDGILVSSLQAVGIFSGLMQEPFKVVPLVWTIHEQEFAYRLREYAKSGRNGLVDNWKKVFSRATVVVFPNYILPMAYSTCDAGNFFVISGSPATACRADNLSASDKDNLRAKMDYGADDFVIAIVGSQLMYKGLWVDHALVLQALLPILERFPADGNSNSRLKIIVVAGDLTSNYSMAIESIVQNLGYPDQIVEHGAFDESDVAINVADIVIYSSLHEERSFPDILLQAMCLAKPIIAPDLSVINKYLHHKVNGYLFPKQNIKVLTLIMMEEVVSNGKLSRLAQNAASIGKQTAKNLMVLETIKGYASLLNHVLRLPSEVAKSQDVMEVPAKLKEEWQWDLFEAVGDTSYQKKSWKITKSLDKLEEQWNHTRRESSSTAPATNEDFVYHIWEDQKQIDLADIRKRREDEELKDRTEQSRGTWEDIYRNARKADRNKNELHERDEGELVRTGQPLCIYEPYFGEGTWPFLHRTSLYRGIGLSTKGRRPGVDDIDAPSRLPLLSNPYYRDVLGDYGAFFAIANRIDRLHKNAWIGFQSWRVTAKKESLSKAAETSLRNALQTRKQGDTVFFWARMDMDPRNPLKQDFWSFCDSVNAGNCRFAFSEALRKMYGIKHNLTSLPPMPVDGDTWSVRNSWVLPTRSFMEFVMFSRMFVDALDAQFYDEHHRSGYCCLSLSKDKHCYSRVLELLINVWAYHSARRMIYVNPETGMMQEQHNLKNRRGQMWVKWFYINTLKSMDEDLAEEVDIDNPKRHWLWPSTGEVFWQGIYEKERNLRNKEKEKRKQKSKDKISRMRRRTRQKALGKYVKPPPDDTENSNSTLLSADDTKNSNSTLVSLDDNENSNSTLVSVRRLR